LALLAVESGAQVRLVRLATKARPGPPGRLVRLASAYLVRPAPLEPVRLGQLELPGPLGLVLLVTLGRLVLPAQLATRVTAGRSETRAQLARLVLLLPLGRPAPPGRPVTLGLASQVPLDHRESRETTGRPATRDQLV
jgi:hypothetical protein